MEAFLCTFKPLSVNADSKRKAKYVQRLVNAFRQYHGTSAPVNGDLYGLVYYFQRVGTGLDADNLSKPVWDALRSVAYFDDKQIKFRISGIFDLLVAGIDVTPDLSSVPDYLYDDFLRMIQCKETDILYIGFDNFNDELILFDLMNK
ncbi:MAG: hypothetical protein JXA33_08850 [Anaerolineae bacterium]|nr:hypothetical protein [Anaerolineae bacterium]